MLADTIGWTADHLSSRQVIAFSLSPSSVEDRSCFMREKTTSDIHVLQMSVYAGIALLVCRRFMFSKLNISTGAFA